MNIQVHGGIGFTWEHDAHLFLRRALVLERAVRLARRRRGRDGAGGPGHERARSSLDLPARGGGDPGRGAGRGRAHRRAARAPSSARRWSRRAYMVPHWPKPWGRAAGAVEQIVIDEELRAAGVKVPALGITGWNIMTVNQYATPDQVERWVFKTLDGRVRLVPAVQRARRRLGRGRGQDAGHAGRRRLDGQRAEGVDERRAVLPPRAGHRADRSRRPEARRHHDDGHRHARARRRGAAAAPDHRQRRLQRGVLRRRVRARRRRGRDARRRVDGGALDAGQRAGLHRRRGRAASSRPMDLLALLKSGGDRVPGASARDRRHPREGPRPARCSTCAGPSGP